LAHRGSQTLASGRTGRAAAKPVIFRRNDGIDEKTQAALSQIGREEKAAAADEVSPIVRHRASIAQLKVMGFAAPVIGPAASGRTRWLNPSYELHSKKTELPRRSEMTRWAKRRHRLAYSTTLSAIARRAGETFKPSPWAVFRLIDSSNLVGACTGRPLGESPFRMRSI